MPRPATALNTVSRKRPDGGREFTWYHRATGALIGRSRDGWTKEAAQARAQELEGAKGKPAPPSGSFGEICALYLSSSQFLARAPRTKAEYSSHIEIMRGMWETVPVHGITRKVVRALHASYADRPWRGNAILRTLRLVMNFAIHELELAGLSKNPAERLSLYETRPRDQIWRQWQIDAFLDAAADQPQLRRACALLLYTVQRPSDMLQLATPMVYQQDGRTWIRLRQGKTSAMVDVPCHSGLERELIRTSAVNSAEGIKARKRRASPLLVASPTGLTWRYRNFARAWDRVRHRANWRIARLAMAEMGGLPPRTQKVARAEAKETIRSRMLDNLQRRDLRRTGMVQLAVAGATTPQIAALSGHSIDRAQKILDTYLPRRGDVALGGVEKWEAGGAGNIVPLVKRVRP
jgi:hypothetical protein